PLPPDEERDRIIKGLTTRLRNVTAELRASREWIKHGADTGMNFKTKSAISLALTSEHKLTEEEREERRVTAAQALQCMALGEPQRRTQSLNQTCAHTVGRNISGG